MLHSSTLIDMKDLDRAKRREREGEKIIRPSISSRSSLWEFQFGSRISVRLPVEFGRKLKTTQHVYTRPVYIRTRTRWNPNIQACPGFDFIRRGMGGFVAGYNTIGILVFRFRSRDAFFLCSRYPVIFSASGDPPSSSPAPLLHFTLFYLGVLPFARSSNTVSPSFSIQDHLSNIFPYIFGKRFVLIFADPLIPFQHFFHLRVL